ncbi:MAG TPA: HAD family hydrolase, partial [Symbiobacteriaceae bacterium]|nr:HAD family hydrolase [Symbiobacteriaceae bacterium]
QLPEAKQAAFWADYSAVVAGEHPALRVGTFFDIPRDLVLETRGGRVLRALHWDGTEIPPVLREQLYPGVVEPDNVTIVNVGDLWWVPTAISFHHGGVAERHGEAFLKVRDVMSDPNFTMAPIPGLADVIASLKGKVIQVLATNSPQPDSEAILTKVGLLGLFDRLYFRSGKPMGLKAIFAELTERYGVGFENLLSVGDNLVNEIAPARAMGCQTVFIDPHRMGQSDDADLVVESMADLIPRLAKLAN